MARSYRHANKRVVRRSGDGRFRRTTLADFGLVAQVCACGQVLTFDPSQVVSPSGFVVPRAAAIREGAPRICHRCGAEVDPRKWG